MEEIITLDFGSGGRKTARLIDDMIVPALDNPALRELGDGAILPGGEKLVFSTDSFVVDPIFFPGGDIGKLAVCGTVNDISMCGGEARFLSCAFIIEEGLPIETLRRVIASMAESARAAGVSIVTGDTKVVERGRGDKIYINTAGIGVLKYPGLSRGAVREWDAVLVSGTVGDHGTAVMLERSGMAQADIVSDCAPLNRLADKLLSSCKGVRVLRDPTRGGLAGTLNEFVEGSALGIDLDEAAVPVNGSVSAACAMLGLDALYCANEGKLVAVVAPEETDAALSALRSLPEGANAQCIGTVTAKHPGQVVARSILGGGRIIQKLTGAQLPRIC